MRIAKEQDWTTKAGFRAVVIFVEMQSITPHRCGYVGVPKGHALYGKGYSEVDDDITVHGGLTFAETGGMHPVESDLHWFGFDCAHFCDTPENCTLAFCVDECEKLAAQL